MEKRGERRSRRSGRRILWTAALCFLLVWTSLGGCARKTETPGWGQAVQEEKLKIGLSFDSFVIERWVRDRDVFVSTAQELGAEVNVQNANGDVEEQIRQIEYFIKKGMDVIAIIAIDGEALEEVVRQARQEGIRIVCYDRLIRNVGADLYVSFDNVKVGTLMGRAMKEALPRGGDIYAIYGSRSDNNVRQVEQGFTQEIEGAGIRIVYSGHCENWLAELAFDYVSEALEEHPQVDGVMCGNDDLASQAIRALAERRLAGKIPVVAQDAELAACQRIVEGTQTMTVYKPVEEEARAAARLAVALAKGEDITAKGAPVRVSGTIDDGSGPIPYYQIDPMAVTGANMDKIIIDSGFHRAEDVYLNVTDTEEAG